MRESFLQAVEKWQLLSPDQQDRWGALHQVTFRHPLAIALYVVAGLIVIAGIALTLLFPPSKLRQLLTEAVSRSVAREVEFQDVRLGLWPPVRLTVRGHSCGTRALTSCGVRNQAGPE